MQFVLMKRVILGSESFLKNFIMEKSLIPYDKVPADIDESIFDHEPVDKRARKLARAKCAKLAVDYPDAVIICAGTLTADEDGAIHTKSKTQEDGFQKAMALSGKTILVYTGCTIYDGNGNFETYLATAKIYYQKFSERTLRRLVKDDNPQIRNSIGIFYDAPGFTLIDKIEGSYTGAMGLPMEFVNQKLAKLLP